MNKLFQSTKNLFLIGIIFLFPFFFLNTTQEFFITNKLYLIAFGSLLLLLITAIKILVTRKISWESRVFDTPVVLFISATVLSVFISSPNKIQALLNPNFGLIIILSLGILYFYFSRFFDHDLSNISILKTITAILSITTVLFFFEPFKGIQLPTQFQFLKNQHFTPLGNQLDLAIFLGFLLVANIILNYVSSQKNKENTIANYSLLGINLIALTITIYKLVTQPAILPPFSTSWFAALETMKNFKTAFFGVGLDNFSTMFSKVKDFNYNQSSLWQIASFIVASNFPLQLAVEVGFLGISAFIYILLSVFKQYKNFANKSLIWLFVYIIIISLFLPPSLTMFFIFFLTLSVVSVQVNGTSKEADLNDMPLIYFGVGLIIFIFVGANSYLLGRSYLAEVYFKKSLNNVTLNNGKEIYDNMKKARILNPYEEKYIINFSQTNILIANNLAGKNKDKITDEDRQIITQAIQAAISEAKYLIGRNPNKSIYYENLANIYRNIISLASGADAWTISAYQRAIILDPANPSYRLSLGGIYYLLGQYNDAIKLFEQAVSLKSNWANASYNLAWGYYQNKEYDKATNAMQNVVNLIDKKSSLKDWEKANKDLEDFKNKLAEIEKNTSGGTNLNLPKASENKLEPKLELPPEASPEAK